MIPLQIRPSDCDSFGHVNNAVYASYVQQALATTLVDLGLAGDWQPNGNYRWQLHSLATEYRQPARLGDQLTAHLWLDEADAQVPAFGCEILRNNAVTLEPDQRIVHAHACWQRLDRRGAQPVCLSEALLNQLPGQPGTLPRTGKLPADDPACRRYRWEHRVMQAEVDIHGLAHPQAIYRWLEESVYDASEQAGWPLARWQEMDRAVWQMRHDSEFWIYPQAGDRVRLTAALVDVRRLRGTWRIDIHRLPQEELLARDYSTGVFLDLAGRPAALPEEIVRDLRGEADGK
jgi:YbgC/YbaW family acyl-CoA thioester hydrolase